MPVIDQAPISYSPGHPWYYLLGGAVPMPRVIMFRVRAKGYKGYLRQDIEEADSKSEPQRSEALRNIRAKAYRELLRDLSGYRRVARALSQYRLAQCPNAPLPVACDPVHQSISLKYNHLYNDCAHLIWLDALLARQGELFAF